MISPLLRNKLSELSLFYLEEIIYSFSLLFRIKLFRVISPLFRMKFLKVKFSIIQNEIVDYFFFIQNKIDHSNFPLSRMMVDSKFSLIQDEIDWTFFGEFI